MTNFHRPGDSPFLRIAAKLHAKQRAATTDSQREAANEELAHFLRMAGAARLDEYIASHPESGDFDDSMVANPEDDA